MPRWASRITLEITEVRVERLNSISEEDAKSEGMTFKDYGKWCFHGEGSVETYDPKVCKARPEYHNQKEGWYWGKSSTSSECLASAKGAFINLWESINGKTHPWASNPFVWCIAFRKL